MTDVRGVPGVVRARIGSFSVALTLVGVTVIALLGWLQFADGADGADLGDSRPVTSSDYYDPWENPDPVAATPDAEDEHVWSGRGQQYIPLTGLTPGRPLELSVSGEDDPFSGIFLTAPGGRSTDGQDYRRPDFHTYGDGPYYLVPTGSEMEVWMRTRVTDPWTVSIRPVDLEERSGTVSGTGSAAFLYTGSASAARVTARGDYGVRIEIITQHGRDDDLRTYQDDSGSIAWEDTASAVFLVRSYDDSTAWTIEFFEPAAEVGDEPDPEAEPESEEPAP